MSAPSAPRNSSSSQAQLVPASQVQTRLHRFEQHYGQPMLELAICAAFPMTLTTDLVCCLRETFVPAVPWYGVADIVLGLCDPVGHDLYEMDGPLRRELLQRLRHQAHKVEQLEGFMLAYISHRLGLEDHDRSRRLGDRPLAEWTALFCVGRHDALVARIRQALQMIDQIPDQRQRLYVQTMAENFGESLLPGTPLYERLEPDSTLDAAIAQFEQALGVKFHPIHFETAQLRRGDAPTPLDPNARQEFEFQTVQLNRRGQIVPPDPAQPLQSCWGYGEDLGPGVPTINLVAIPGGEFAMGSPPTEAERYDDEGPVHRVQVPPFFIGQTAVTQAQWRVVAGWWPVERDLDPDPSQFKGDDRPVESITWLAAMEFCARLSRETGRNYSLPSEAEWEYACRAGTTTAFNFGDMISPQVANYDWDQSYAGVNLKQAKPFEGTVPVKTFAANAWGLYEMHGNVWEWCEDHWHDNYDAAPSDGSAWLDPTAETTAARVIRGGSWVDYPGNCRSAVRISDFADSAFYLGGFRIVSRLPRTP